MKLGEWPTAGPQTGENPVIETPAEKTSWPKDFLAKVKTYKGEKVEFGFIDQIIKIADGKINAEDGPFGEEWKAEDYRDFLEQAGYSRE